MRANAEQIRGLLGDRKVIEAKDRAIYYSSWHYAAVHMLLTIDQFHSPAKIADQLHLSLPRVNEIIDVLRKMAIITISDNCYEVIMDSVHLDNEAPEIKHHHVNLRHKAIQSLTEHNDSNNLHFSTFLTCGVKDIARIRKKLLKTIKECSQMIQDSKPEEAAGMNIDFYQL